MKKSIKFFLFIILSFSFVLSKDHHVFAQSNNIPKELLEVVTKIDLAANNQDLKLIEQNISPKFTTEDGLNYENFTSSLKNLWSKYKDLKYTTKIESWKQNQDQLVATTITNIQGSYDINGKKFTLNSEIKSEQYFLNNQLIKQKILTEKNEVTSGEKPPIATVNLPQKARPGQEFDFDVILQDPIGSYSVLGGVLENKIDSSLYLKPSTLELDTLSAGGIFKRVKLPMTPEDHWYSVILINTDGMRMITQRVNVEG
ncbi:nuclear transport factor 2 family protein [Geminocystis sp. GBBB08]|uniref:nuclear transport factor 2 family protein n=1 Tax=Geminocystis sp. GBBB08 TaxID=2604140 RepID=UPI0027E33125|nr:nuclear transport factor 2 family protein [Geminocystis sp. GBBB08]MBL1209576.1 nuclear transport factor 2 family protein [Geminocystis sp. GBBB08]